jgi:hypothetical protein
MSQAFVPVAMGGRFQDVTATTVAPIATSDLLPIGPCSTISVGGAGNLVLGMWDGSTVTIPVVAGQELQVSPKLVKTATTATNLFAKY